MLAACGAQTVEPGASLESWRDAACRINDSMDPAGAPAADDPPFSTDGDRRELTRIRSAAAELRAIPAPDEHRADIDRFVALLERYADEHEAALPKIEAASRRLERVMASIDEHELPPPPAEPSTVAGTIMSQMMSIPEVAEAWKELMRAYESIGAGTDTAELERLARRLGLEQCEQKAKEAARLSEEELARCGGRGEPVTLAELVAVFRENGITLDIQEDVCGKPEEKQVAGFDSDATNTGPDGFDSSHRRDEGHVMCDVGDESSGRREVQANKYPTDTETRMWVLNVDCVIYPDSTEREAAQVGRLRKAMEAIADRAS
jgi:hypothetical protein